MDIRCKLLAGAALATLAAGAAQAASPKKHHAAPSANQQLLDEVRALRAEVSTLRAKVDATSSTAVNTQAQVVATQAQVQQVQTQVAAAPPVTQAQVDTTVKTQIASAVEKEHHNDKFYFKGVTITPGGFVEAAGIYRSRFQGDDIASNFTIPFPGQSHPSHTSEGRFSARQSRFSLLAQGNVNKQTQLSMYAEMDFQGAAQTSNSNQSNSYVPRLRLFYGAIDHVTDTGGLHFQAGQNWSLLTFQGKGMTARAEQIPPQIDAQYIPGFAWARQPGVRLIADTANHHLWFGLAAENPQTTFGGTGVPANFVSVINGQGLTAASLSCTGAAATTCTLSPTPGQAPPPGSFQQFYNGAGASLSLNHVPDFIAKVAYDRMVVDHEVHVEGFGIYRSFTDHLDGAGDDRTAHSFGYGGSIFVNVIPKLLDVQFSGIGGAGIGRYGSAGLPDVTFDREGREHPLNEFMLLAGATVHASKALDIYGFAGEEQEYRKVLDNGAAGYGLNAIDSGCFQETSTTNTTAVCQGNTRRIRQLTVGFWDKFYQGAFGRAQVGVQYSYTERQLFEGVGYPDRPQTHNNMGFVSFRYYPF
jgi:hypothetical protein